MVTAPHAARPVPRVLQPLAGRMADQRTREVFQRDPDYLERCLPVLRLYARYFSPEVRGLENLPEDGPVLVVGNHSGLFYLPDATIISLAIIERRGLDHPAFGLTYDLLFAVPWYGGFLRRVGAIPAGNHEADAALEKGALVLDFPGGDWESSRPWGQRDRVDFGGRHGFVRLALRHQVPIVPVVSHGAQHAVIVLARGDRLAQAMNLGGIHIHVFPFLLGPPFGVNPIIGPVLPAKVTAQFLPALDWSRYGPDAAHDDDVVQACYDEIISVMQHALDELRLRRPHPLVSGAAGLVRDVATAPLRLLR